MTVLPLEQPPIDYLTQGAGAMKYVLIDPATSVYLIVSAGVPASGEGNGWLGKGSLVIDATNGDMYQNTGTRAATVFTVFENSGDNLFTAANALTAHAGGGKASALALTKQISRLSTVATAHDSVLLPASAAGGIAVVINDGATGADIYGAGTDTINGVATANPTFIANGQTMVFWSAVAGKWNSANSSTAATSQAQPADPVAPASTAAYFMQGLAGTFTPTKSGKVLFMVSGMMKSSSVTAGDGILAQLSYGTGAAPANAAALTGTQIGNIVKYENPTTVIAADVFVPFHTQCAVTGLTLGTAYWFDLAAKSIANISNIGLTGLSVTAVEI